MVNEENRERVEKIIDFIKSTFRNEVKANLILEKKPGKYLSLPDDIHPSCQQALKGSGITALYSHQFEAYRSILDLQDTLIISQTASGKTLAFLLPILNDYLKNKANFSVLLLYPTKALSRDQEGTLSKLMRPIIKDRRLGTFDGDTPAEHRALLSRNADFIITNPDMLHSGILPNHNRKWRRFLSRLRYIVVDEVHTYRGAFGSHTSNIFRRLLRVCEVHGSRPIFICSSATIGNPLSHVKALFHRDFQVISNDGAPKPQRLLYFINPPLVQEQDSYYRKGTSSVSIPIIRHATLNKIRTICFCRARQQVERLYRAVIDGYPELQATIKPYRGGLLPNERRKLEGDLFEGRINTIITTNALELGIDIGTLELCILTGHPGSTTSFWQQAGRVGRSGHKSVTVFIGRNTPIDQFLVHNARFLLDTPIEQAWLCAENPYIFLQHLPCAAHEYPLRKQEPLFNQVVLDEAKEILTKNKTLTKYQDYLRYIGPNYPARGVNIRGMTDYNVEIYHGSQVIGEIDPIGARGTLYKDAIYHHLGKRYMSVDLDLEKKLAKVERVDVDYYTEAVWENRINMLERFFEKNIGNTRIEFGCVYVNLQPKLYKKIRERSYENIGYGPITLAPFEYETNGVSIQIAEEWILAIAKLDKRYIFAAYYGIAYLFRNIGPTICMGDRKDLSTDVSLAIGQNSWKSSIFLFDTHEGGVGYAEKIYERIQELITLSLKMITRCECRLGCPACVPPLTAGIENEELYQLLVETNASIECTKSLLEFLVTQKIRLPEVRITKRRDNQLLANPPKKDIDLKNLRDRLGRAASILEKKREKLH